MKRKVIKAILTVVAVSVIGTTVTLNKREEEWVTVTIPTETSEMEEVEPVEEEREITYHTYIDEEYIGYVEEISERYNVCPELIMAIIEQESSGNPNAKNADCLGLMQVSERWHKDRMERLGVTSLFDPYGNILVGVDYIVELAETYGDLDMVLMTYNGSSDAEERWINGAPTKYATGIINRSIELEGLHDKLDYGR